MSILPKFPNLSDVSVKENLMKLPGIGMAIKAADGMLNGSTTALNTLLDWAVNIVNVNIPGVDKADELAAKYLKNDGTPLEKQIDSMVNSQLVKCGLYSTATSVPGIATLPLNLVGTTYLQVCTVAAIAKMCGHNIDDPKIKKTIVACFLGGQVAERIGQMVAEQAAKQVAKRSVLKVIPGVGSIIGGTMDVVATKAICAAAKKKFMNDLVDHVDDEKA